MATRLGRRVAAQGQLNAVVCKDLRKCCRMIQVRYVLVAESVGLPKIGGGREETFEES